jgi:phosphate transport system substrate-binding protein
MNRRQDMIDTYRLRQGTKSYHRPPLVGIILPSCLLCLCLLLAACGGSAANKAQTASNSDETAIDNFLADAPVAAKNAAVTPQTRVAVTTTSSIPLPEINPLMVVGDITIAGSSTVVDLTNQIYVRFVADGYAGFIKLEELSTSDGFQAFCQGTTDSVAATRPILQEELDSCLRLGRTPVVFPIGTDALVVVVNQANDFVKDVTLAELAEIFKAKRWSDVNKAWPAHKIMRILPQSTADDFLFFADVVFQGNNRLLETASNSSFLPDAIEIMQQIQDNPDAIGLINYTTYRAQSNAVRLVKLGGLQPDLTTMQKGTYPLRRPLLFYSAPEVLKSKLQLGGFLTFYLTFVNEEISQQGKFPLTRAEMDRSRLNLLVGTANEAYLDDLRDATKP